MPGGVESDAVQSVVLFQLAAGGLDVASVVPRPDGAPVLAYQGGDDVDVVVGVADSDPPDGVEITVRGQADCVHDGGGRVGPLLIAQCGIAADVVYGAVPDRGARWVDTGRDGLLQ
jgi:hypothetical protein